MACPTCDHTMQGVGYGLFHCPRCGTLIGAPAAECVVVPALVARCRRYGYGVAAPHVSADCLRDNWHEAGIPESIFRPAERKG